VPASCVIDAPTLTPTDVGAYTPHARPPARAPQWVVRVRGAHVEVVRVARDWSCVVQLTDLRCSLADALVAAREKAAALNRVYSR
jgi:hypothetical protein